MRTVTVRRLIPADVDKVFDLLTDHAAYEKFPGIRRSQLLEAGDAHRNGVGALREIDAGSLWVQERITAYEPNARMDYLIVKSRPPLKHQGGSLRFTAVDGGTEVLWTSTFEFGVPLLQYLVTPLLVSRTEPAFAGLLRAVERRLAA